LVDVEVVYILHISMPKVVSFEDLGEADLIIDAVYEGGNFKDVRADPISKILPGSGNQGGFRIAGKFQAPKFITLYTSGEDKDWPDTLNLNTGQFVYFGDNKTPGHELHDTSKGGNELLRIVFEYLHTSQRQKIAPFFIFKKYPTNLSARSVQFKGLAVPGFPGVASTEDLVAIWKTTNGQRFQNYRSIFTVLDIPVIGRKWINDLEDQKFASDTAPQPWIRWRNNGNYEPLTSQPTTIIRSLEQQVPDTPLKKQILKTVWKYFEYTPIAFEAFSARIFQMYDQRVIIDEITRGTIDGGRDAIGRYVLGLNDDPVYAEFSLEAKCYRPSFDGISANTVGVKEVSRLISRIRHRQFGVLVTTSLVARQAYEEVRTDRHPIIFICGKDIAEILIANGYNTVELVEGLLTQDYLKNK
jgi:hypothetical protein